MALWLIVRQRKVIVDPLEPDTYHDEHPPTTNLELVGTAEANADKPKDAAESIAQDPSYRYVAVRYDTAEVFDADPRPVTLKAVKPPKKTSAK